MIRRILSLLSISLVFGFFVVFVNPQISNSTDNSANLFRSVSLNSNTSNEAPSPSAEVLSVSLLSKDLFLNTKGDEVKLLQTWLAKDVEVYPDGIVSGTFDKNTQEAVKKYQVKNGIIILNNIKGKKQVTPAGHGSVGAITRASLNSQYGNKNEGATWVAGKYGAGLSLRGGYVEIPSTDKLDLTFKEGVVLDAWINPSVLLKTKEIIFARDNHYGLGITEGGKIFVRQNGKDIITTKRYIKTNEWQQISATFLDDKVIFKYNDKQVEVKKYNIKVVVPGTDPLLVGVSFDPKKGFGEAYIGALDNVYIYTIPNKKLAPLPKVRLVFDDAIGSNTKSLTGVFTGELKVALADKELLKTRIPETKVPELIPVKKEEESKYPKAVEKAVEVVQNIIQQTTGIQMGGGGGSVVEQPAPIQNNGTPPDPNFPMPPHGQQIVYSVSSGSSPIVKFTKVDINPLVVYPGDTQTLKATVTTLSGTIASVQSSTRLDTSTKTLDFVNDGTGTNTWVASWVVSDTHVNIYKTTFTATDSFGNTGATDFAWSDPCTGLTDGSNSTLGANCTISVVDGVDGGSVTIPAGRTLTLNPGAVFVVNPGKSMTNYGRINLSGASMRQAYLFYTDADNDNYPGSIVTRTYSTSDDTSNNGLVRVATVVAQGYTTDVNDNPAAGGASIQINSSCYLDADGDGVWSTSPTSTATSSSGCTATNAAYHTSAGTDCNDGSATYYAMGYGLDADGDGYGTSAYGCYNGSAVANLDATLGTDCNDSAFAIKAGSTRTGYTNANPSCGSSCAGVQQTQTCQSNGTWTGSGITSCTEPTGCCVGNMGAACGTCNNGTIQCNGSCSGGYANYTYGAACNRNSCGGTGTINDECSGTCSASAPPEYGTAACGTNACGSGNTNNCTGACNDPAPPTVYTQSACNINACGTAGGTIGQCTGTCSGSTPATPYTVGAACTSAANACGTTASGTITDACTGACSASTPATPYTVGAECNACGTITNACTGACSAALSQCRACDYLACTPDGTCTSGTCENYWCTINQQCQW